MIRFCFYCAALCILLTGSCKEKNPYDNDIPVDSSFTASTHPMKVELDEITEASGLAASKINPDAYWTHNDSGGENAVYLMDSTGKHLGEYHLKGVPNRDWEDLAAGPGPNEKLSYLYVGDIGDNFAKREIKCIYRFPEPKWSGKRKPDHQKIHQIDSIRFRYPDGTRDSETLMIDPWTKDIYIVSKREMKCKVYIARYPQSLSQVITLEKVFDLHFSGATAGDISPDGLEVLIKNYANVYYWQRKKGESLRATFKRCGLPKRLPYKKELIGEAICFTSNDSGYLTLSEEKNGIPAYLLFYKRLKKQSEKWSTSLKRTH